MLKTMEARLLPKWAGVCVCVSAQVGAQEPLVVYTPAGETHAHGGLHATNRQICRMEICGEIARDSARRRRPNFCTF